MNKPSLHIGILGTRGIPNRYGGFEAFAEQLAPRLAEKGHRVTVFCSHDQENKDRVFKNVKLDFQYNPEKIFGTFGQFIYDLNCNLKASRDKFQILLHLGYTSDSVWHRLWPRNTVHITNMDGFEWRRAKYSKPVQNFLKQAESWAAGNSQALVADSPVILDYLQKNYKTPAFYIGYGAEIPDSFNENLLFPFGLTMGRYDLIIARMEPENNIELAVRAHLLSDRNTPLVIIANETNYGKSLKNRFCHNLSVRFLPPCYDRNTLHALRHFARYYIHGHSAGGTNPSLLEAMACGCRILAHDNPFNRSVLEGNSAFYDHAEALAELISRPADNLDFNQWGRNNVERIRNYFSWDYITDSYEALFFRTLCFPKD
jgi:glycosyltransferase involved in cell wall biosynthesis